MKQNNQGQTLIMLLVFISLAITVTASAVALIVSNTSANSKFELGQVTTQAAESGAEIALLKLLRDQSYNTDSFTLDNVAVAISVTGTTTKTVTSQATMSNFIKKVQLVLDTPSSGLVTITSWKEIF